MNSDDQPINDPSDASDTDEANEDSEGLICPHCMRSIARDAHFCPHCNGPVTTIASMDPLGHIYALGFGFAKAVEKPTKPILFWGMWILLGSQVLIFLNSIVPLFLLIFRVDVEPPLRLALLCLVIGWTGLTALCCLMLYKTTKNYVRLKKARIIESAICLQCGYDLRGSAESFQCPECGEPIPQLGNDDHEHDPPSDGSR